MEIEFEAQSNVMEYIRQEIHRKNIKFSYTQTVFSDQYAEFIFHLIRIDEILTQSIFLDDFRSRYY